MAIGIFKSLEFGGINSADYGVYITGKAVYNAPERAVEQVDIPGRNGAFLMDLGRFENIEVTYPCGIPGDDQTDFAEKISEFRNAILSKRGYQRLTDEYNPSEYRMASYVSGMEVEAVEGQQGTVGEFELTFNCKPQRWLTSGETAVTVADGDTLTNPTLFDSEPLLEVEGYGTIGFNNYTIELENAQMGLVEIVSGEAMSKTSWNSSTHTTVFESEAIPTSEYANAGDSFTVSANIIEPYISISIGSIKSATISTSPTNGTASVTFTNKAPTLRISGITLSGTIDTDAQVTTSSVATITYTNNIDATLTDTITVSVTLAFDADTQKITLTSVATATGAFISMGKGESSIESFEVDSTVSILGHPTYVDCELGECYRIENGTIISLNAYIDLGSDIPKLAPGTNTFSIDNTITDLTVTPRWWKV